jgi:hypothetical protein
MEQRWNGIDRGNQMTLRKTCQSAPLSTTNPTWTALGANKFVRDENQVTNHLSYSMTLLLT